MCISTDLLPVYSKCATRGSRQHPFQSLPCLTGAAELSVIPTPSRYQRRPSTITLRKLICLDGRYRSTLLLRMSLVSQCGLSTPVSMLTLIVEYRGIGWNNSQEYEPDSLFSCLPSEWSSSTLKCDVNEPGTRVSTHIVIVYTQ